MIETEVNIPKRIHQTRKTNEVPDEIYYHKLIESWKVHHPHWDYKFWTDENNRHLVEKWYPQYLPLYDSLKPICKSDMIRYLYMHKYGGIYVELDFKCFRSLDPILQHHDIYVGSIETESLYKYPNAFLASKPGLQFWLNVIEDIKNADETQKAEDVSGSRILTNHVKQSYKNYDICILPKRYIYPIDWHDDSFTKDNLKRENIEKKEYSSYCATAWVHNWTKAKHVWYLEELYNDALDSLNNISSPEGEGRGIVTCAGNRRTYTSAYLMIKQLRESGCKLPVEVWCYQWEHDNRWKNLLKNLGDVSVRTAPNITENVQESQRKGWVLKPYAIIHSRFNEVLFLDSDCMPVKNPHFLFDSNPYQRHGAIFWPEGGIKTHKDLNQYVQKEINSRHLISFFVGNEAEQEIEFESAQMLINKQRCWRALNLALHFCIRGNIYFQHFFGDKEAFHLAWRLLGTPYHMMPAVDMKRAHSTYKIFHQKDFNGERLFDHRAGDKYDIAKAEWNYDYTDTVRHRWCVAEVQQLRQEIVKHSANKWKPEQSVAIAVGCKDRQQNLNISLQSWLACPEVDEVNVVDWGSAEPITQDTPPLAMSA